jgi:FMN phosphatase YigB (HAD superfamily)
MVDTRQKGDFPEVDSPKIWRKLLARLGEKDYDYNLAFYGDPEELSDKVAYFFHANMQGVEAAPNAHLALMSIASSRFKQALLSDAQAFTIVQMLRALKQQGTLPPLGGLFALTCSTLSFQEGLRTPSKTLYERCLQKFAAEGIAPQEILHVSSRLKDDLAVAKQAGMRTALYAGDPTSLRASKDDMKDPDIRPDRLLTNLFQIREILSLK